jgi:hypothetical protein
MSAGQRLQRLEGIDVASMTAGDAHAALRDIGVIRGATDQIEAAIARRIAALHTVGRAGPASDALGRNGRSSRRAAERTERRADTLGHTPRLDDALAKGKVGAEHADALAGAASRLDDDQRSQLFAMDSQLTELAASKTPESFRRDVNKIVDEITDDDGLDRAARQVAASTLASGVDSTSGMYWFRCEVAPEQGTRLRKAIDHEATALAKRPEHRSARRDHLDALALIQLATGARGDGAAVNIDMLVTVPLASLDGSGRKPAEYSDGTTMPIASARRLACEARIIPVVLDGDGMPLDVGRHKRLATRSQRAALRTMYRTCAIDECDRNFDRCHIHHLVEWDDLGPTDMANLVPLCSFHHHRAHEGRWQLQLDASSRQLTVHLPGGALHSRSVPDIVAERAA